MEESYYVLSGMYKRECEEYNRLGKPALPTVELPTAMLNAVKTQNHKLSKG